MTRHDYTPGSLLGPAPSPEEDNAHFSRLKPVPLANLRPVPLASLVPLYLVAPALLTKRRAVQMLVAANLARGTTERGNGNRAKRRLQPLTQ